MVMHHGRVRCFPPIGAREFVAMSMRWVLRQEAVVLVAGLCLLVALFGFAKITEEVLEGEMRDFDRAILLLLRQPGDTHIPVGPQWLPEAAHDVTALGGRTLLVAVMVSAVGYLALERKYGAMWLLAVASLGGGILTIGLKELFERGRPDVVPHFVSVMSPSYPSGHSTLCAVLYLTLGALLARFAARRRTKAFCLSLAILATLAVGGSRVYLGVHYPTDVLAGWCAGFAWALICWLVARYLQYRGVVDRTGRT
jgi:undecaprenyl-diphosphatase